MADTSPFHPELRRVAAFLPRQIVVPWLLPILRRLTGRLAKQVPGDVEVAEASGVTVRIYSPPDGERPGPALLWIHGGGLILGVAAQDDDLCREYAQRARCMVVSVEYRLAPEHRYPAAVEDCVSALSWLFEHPDVDPARVAVGGASAGGGLAAATVLLARERGLPRPVLQMLVYPMLDDRTAARPDPDAANRRLWSNRANAFGWRSYTGLEPGAAGVSGFAAPARHEDLSNLPAAWVGTGTCDLFLEEDLEYARRLEAAGVACSTEVVEGAFHAFDVVGSSTGVGKAFRSAQIRALVDAFEK